MLLGANLCLVGSAGSTACSTLLTGEVCERRDQRGREHEFRQHLANDANQANAAAAIAIATATTIATNTATDTATAVAL